MFIKYRFLFLAAVLASGVCCAQNVPSVTQPNDKSSISSNDITGGISLSATRVIYNEGGNDVGVKVNNTSNIPFLIQSWVSAYKGKGYESAKELDTNTFIITPPLFRLDNGSNTVRLMRVGGSFPADRESVFWINVKSVPSSDIPKKGGNYVQFAFNNRIKLFYRPANLKGVANDAAKSLTFNRRGDTLVANNTTPYHITIHQLSVGGINIKDIDQKMVPPLSQQTWGLPASAKGNVLSFNVINDVGGISEKITKSID